MRFSERHGYRPIRTALQVNTADRDLRNSIWNVIDTWILEPMRRYDRAGVMAYTHPNNAQITTKEKAELFWGDLYRNPLDELPATAEAFSEYVKDRVIKRDWYEGYEFIDFYLQYYRPQPKNNITFQDHCNAILQREMSAWRVVDEGIARLTSDEEIAAVEEAERVEGAFAGAAQHIRNAVRLLSDRKEPDYPNSMKESISAVEAVCHVITGDAKATLGDALKRLAGRGVLMHSAARSALSQLYGYTSNADGIRHASIDVSTVDFDDAKFMLVACSAFVSSV
jgi:hypothetical protein